MTGFFLAGSLAPFGLSVSFLHRPLAEVRAGLHDWRRQLGQTLEESGPVPFPECVPLLEPFEAPWTTELLIDSGEWTTYLNNWIGGGDPTAAAPALSTRLACDAVIAMHVPRHAPGHASTQLILRGPSGDRSLCAHATSGHWTWDTYGEPRPWEKTERYVARRIRDRLDRALLVDYLAALGIRVDDASFYGDGYRVRQVVTYQRRQEPAAQVLAGFGWRT